MKAKINSWHDLHAERMRLEAALAIQSAMIRKDVNDLREELQPIRSVLAFTGKLISRDKRNPLFSMGVDVIGDLFFKNFLFSRAGFITKHVAPFLLKNLSSNFLSKNGDNVLDMLSQKVRHFAAKFRKQGGELETKN